MPASTSSEANDVLSTVTDLKNAQLRYVSGETPGFTRKAWGKGFRYFDQHGEVIRDRTLREWITSLVIPPAWEEVWISPYKNGHLLVTGRDSKRRKQYIYHPKWIALRNESKFDQLNQFGACLPVIRETTDTHLRQQKLSRTRILAAVVRLLEHTLIRIGNDEYVRANESYGLTTLRDKHTRIDGATITFEFAGKSGKEHAVTLHDRRLARVVKQSRDIPGYALFQYYDENGDRQVIDSSDVNGYLHEITGEHFTAKMFRTWGASINAIRYLCENCAESQTDRAVQMCVAHVAEALGNTKSVSRKYYIHPAILEAHLNGELLPIYEKYTKQKKSASPYALTPEEKTLVALTEGG